MLVFPLDQIGNITYTEKLERLHITRSQFDSYSGGMSMGSDAESWGSPRHAPPAPRYSDRRKRNRMNLNVIIEIVVIIVIVVITVVIKIKIKIKSKLG